MVKVNAIFQEIMTEGVQGTNASDRAVADKDILVSWMALSALLYTPRDQPVTWVRFLSPCHYNSLTWHLVITLWFRYCCNDTSGNKYMDRPHTNTHCWAVRDYNKTEDRTLMRQSSEAISMTITARAICLPSSKVKDCTPLPKSAQIGSKSSPSSCVPVSGVAAE